MNHFTYVYCQKYQTLVRVSPSGEELQRFYLPFSDLSKVCATLFGASADKLLMKGEEE